MYIWFHGAWDHVNGVLLETQQKIGTVKVFKGYSGSLHDVPDFEIMKKLSFWDFNTDQKEWRSMNDTVHPKQTVQKKPKMNTVPYKNKSTSKQTRQFITSKQMAKLMKQGETVFLAMIRPSNQPIQGMTQKAKLQKMKETGPVRKAPPVAETRKRMCSEAPADMRAELDQLL